MSAKFILRSCTSNQKQKRHANGPTLVQCSLLFADYEWEDFVSRGTTVNTQYKTIIKTFAKISLLKIQKKCENSIHLMNENVPCKTAFLVYIIHDN